jgi:hypothetical protein
MLLRGGIQHSFTNAVDNDSIVAGHHDFTTARTCAYKESLCLLVINPSRVPSADTRNLIRLNEVSKRKDYSFLP